MYVRSMFNTHLFQCRLKFRCYDIIKYDRMCSKLRRVLLYSTAWPAKNLSNMVRLALVWRFGGFYTDFDTICLRGVQNLSNVVGSQSSKFVNNAVFHFEHHHPLIQEIMEEQNENFDVRILLHIRQTQPMNKRCIVSLVYTHQIIEAWLVRERERETWLISH